MSELAPPSPTRPSPVDDSLIPTFSRLDDVYLTARVSFERKRWRRLITAHLKEYGDFPRFVARAPGRVNIIGEHVDYSLFSVLPMAIEEDVLLSCSSPMSPLPAGCGCLSLANIDPLFARKDWKWTDHGPVEDFEYPQNAWTNYFLAALDGSLKTMDTEGAVRRRAVNCQMMVDGNVPHGAGLSSSAALVVASALALWHVDSQRSPEIRKLDFVGEVMVYERAVGVNSGGMDQSASVLAVKNRALHVSFYPELSASIIRLPQSNSAPFIFLIAQSLVHAKKSDSAETQYNLRVVECTLAALYLAHSLQLHKFYHIEGIDTSPLGFSLLSLLMLFRPRRRRRPNGHKDLDEGELQRRRIQDLLPEVDDILYQSDGYTIGEVAEHLKISEEELSKRYMTKFPIRAERFLLHQRAMHVYREALRVLDFVSILTSIARAGADAADTLSELGTLMNKSQYSLNGLYDCSCPEIEQMCKIAREHGSYGSRLTGAGWGGCTVHLVPEGRLAEIKGALEKEYYRQRDPDITEQELDRAMIVTRPGNGACLFDISKSDLI